jgi:DNA-binding MarR family transcriptional regulator
MPPFPTVERTSIDAENPWPVVDDPMLFRSTTFRVLVAMAASPRKKHRRTELADATGMQPQDVSKILRVLADHGLTVAQQDPAKRTIRLHQLTKLGRACAAHRPDRTRPRQVDPAHATVEAAVRSLPHRGTCSPNQDCDLLLLRLRTYRFVVAMARTSRPAFSLRQITAMPELSAIPEHTVARCMRILARRRLAVRESDSGNRRIAVYRLTFGGYVWADQQLPQLDEPARLPDGKRCWPDLRTIAVALVLNSSTSLTNAALARMTGLKTGNFWLVRQLLVHRGLAHWNDATAPRRSHNRRVRLTEAGHAWATHDIESILACSRERSPRRTRLATARDRVVCGVLEDLANPHTVWTDWLPPMTTLAARYSVSEPTVASAMKELCDRGVIRWQQPARGRVWAYAIIRPNQATRVTSRPLLHGIAASSTGRSVNLYRERDTHESRSYHRASRLTLAQLLDPVRSDYTDPASAWHTDEPSTCDLVVHFGVPAPSLPCVLREYLAHEVRNAGSLTHKPARSDRSAWHVPERPPTWSDPALLTSTQLYAGLRWLLAFASSDVLPATATIADQYDLDHDQLAQAMNIFATAGAVGPQHQADGAETWTRRPGWALSTRDPVIRAIVIEMARRVDTGWYLWTGLDGETYSRPFPSADDVAEQFHVGRVIACQAIMHLHRLGFLWAVSLPPRRFVGIETKCLLTSWGGHYALADPNELREAIDQAASFCRGSGRENWPSRSVNVVEDVR